MRYCVINNTDSLAADPQCFSLLTVVDKWTEILDKGNSVDVIFCDFQNGFDTVPHRHLLETLSYYGIENTCVGVD